MALFRPDPPPRRGRSDVPLSVPPGTSGAASAAGSSTASATSPIGDATAAGSSTASAVGAAIVAGAASATGTSTATAASSNVFPLTISPDGRYLLQADGAPFLICADTTWSLFCDIPIADIGTFLTNIKAKGFNAVMGNIIEHHYTTSVPPRNHAGDLPFTKRLDGNTFTGSPNGTNALNGTQGQFSPDPYANINTQAADWTFPNNTYWQGVETILDACLAANVLVFPWVAYLGFHANDEGWMAEMVALDAVVGAGGFVGQPWADNTKPRTWNYGAWLAQRWKNYPHLIWTMGGDYGSGANPLTTAQKSAVNNIMAGLKSVTGQQSTFFTAHWDRPALATDVVLTAGSFDLNLCYCDEAVAEVTRRGYAHTPTIPTFLGEYYYEDDLFGGSAPYRKYVWWGFLGGIAGGFFGNEQLWRFDDGTPGTDYTTLESTQATNDAARQFAFYKARPWHRLKPSGLGGMGTLVTAGGGTAVPQSTSYVAAAATPEGDLLLAYVPPAHTGTITVDMTKLAATAQARWFDPTNATFTNIGSIANTGTHVFTTPATNSAGDADFLLVLETSAGAATAAGTSTASATGTSTTTVVASSAGSSTATAVGASIATGAATAAGAATVTGVGASIASGAAAASGASTADSTAPAADGTATASGTSTAAAVGASIAAGAAAAAGTSTARAFAVTVADATATEFDALVAMMDDAIISILG